MDASSDADPATSADYCDGGCNTDQFCYYEVQGVVDGGSFSVCKALGDACATCACLEQTGCPLTECGINHGVVQLACFNN